MSKCHYCNEPISPDNCGDIGVYNDAQGSTHGVACDKCSQLYQVKITKPGQATTSVSQKTAYQLAIWLPNIADIFRDGVELLVISKTEGE